MKSSRIALALVLIAGALLGASGPGTRFGLWPFPAGLQLLLGAAALGLVGAAIALVGLLRRRARAGQAGGLAAALVLGVGVALVPGYWLLAAFAVPAIHDISTDLEDPPAFVAVLPLRADAPNPAIHGGAELAQAQRRGYPDIRPGHLALPPAQAFARALEAARRMGWEVVGEDEPGGRIEATATSFWFGFADDVVIRLRPEGEGSRIDLRSVSRVGRSDVGANAARIRAYLSALGAQAPPGLRAGTASPDRGR